MKQKYLASNRGRVHLLASLVLSAAVGLALGSASHPVVGVLGGIACTAVLVVLGYAVFIVEVRTNSLVRGPDGQRSSNRAGTPPASAAVATASSDADGPVTTAGRGAARQLSGPEDERTLWRLSRDVPSQPIRVATVAAKELTTRLPADEVVALVPGYATADLESGAYRALVLDRTAFCRGPWAGAESAVGTHLLRQLENLVDLARRRRIPVLFVDAPLVPDIGSQETRRLADLVLPLPPCDYPPEGAANSQLLTMLQQAGRDRFEATTAPTAPGAPAGSATAGSRRG